MCVHIKNTENFSELRVRAAHGFRNSDSEANRITGAFDDQRLKTISYRCESLGGGFKLPEILRQKCLCRMEGMQISSHRQIWKRWQRSGTDWEKELNDQGDTVDQLSAGKSVRLSAAERHRGSPFGHVAMRGHENTGALCGRMSLL